MRPKDKILDGGEYHGISEINAIIENIYVKITTWKMNLFELPRGKSGKDYIEEAINMLRLFNQRTSWEPIAINILQLFPALMLHDNVMILEQFQYC